MTGLIYVVIIAVWAVVLVPGWLHRHDRRQLGYRNPRVAAFMSRMAARTSVLGIPLPGRPEQGGRADDEGPQPDREHPRRRGRRARARRARRARLARGRRTRGAGRSSAARRRLTLALLTLIWGGIAVAVAAGLLPPVALAGPVPLILGFLVLSRSQVRRARRTRGRAARRTGSRHGDASGSEAAPAAPTHAPGTWEPRSTPLPRYVTAAREQAALDEAERSGRPVGATRPQAQVWTAAAMLERAQQQERARQVRAQAEQRRAARAGIDRKALGADDDRDEEFLRRQATAWRAAAQAPFRRASNE